MDNKLCKEHTHCNDDCTSCANNVYSINTSLRENIKKMQDNEKLSYFNAFEIQSLQQNFMKTLSGLGLASEYGNGCVGKFMLSVSDSSIDIIMSSLGLHLESKPNTIEILGQIFPTEVEIFYPYDNNSDFAITADDFYDFVTNSPDNEDIKLLWDAIVNRNTESKEKFNQRNNATIGNLGTWRLK